MNEDCIEHVSITNSKISQKTFMLATDSMDVHTRIYAALVTLRSNSLSSSAGTLVSIIVYIEAMINLPNETSIEQRRM